MLISVQVSYGSKIYNLEKPYVEAIAKAYKQSGISCVSKLNGSFAMVIVDDGITYLIGDRYGSKPLYYCVRGGQIYYHRRIRSIRLDAPPTVDLEALHEYFTFQNILSDKTLFSGIKILPPGCIGVWHSGKLEIIRYWDYQFGGYPVSDKADRSAEILRLLSQAVSNQTQDRPHPGVYLSGGLDSATVATLVTKEHGKVLTFTCGFDVNGADVKEAAYDERKYAELMARHIHSRNYQVVLEPECIPAVIPSLINSLEEPRIGQCYPDYYISDLAGKLVDTVLSGAGGDEIFGGYPWHYRHNSSTESYYGFYSRLIKDEDKPIFFRPEIYARMKGNPARESFQELWDRGGSNNADKCQYVDAHSSLRGLLIILDKISSPMGLDIRYPLLDNDLVDYAMSIPLEQKCRNNVGKLPLRDAIGGIIPLEILLREKQGFAAPDSSWYRVTLKPYLEELLGKNSARIYDYLNHDYVSRCLTQHYQGVANYRALIWSLISFEWWLRKFDIGSPK